MRRQDSQRSSGSYSLYGLRIKEVVYTLGKDYLFDPQSVLIVLAFTTPVRSFVSKTQARGA